MRLEDNPARFRSQSSARYVLNVARPHVVGHDGNCNNTGNESAGGVYVLNAARPLELRTCSRHTGTGPNLLRRYLG